MRSTKKFFPLYIQLTSNKEKGKDKDNKNPLRICRIGNSKIQESCKI